MRNLFLFVVILFLSSCASQERLQVTEDRMSVGQITKEDMVVKMRQSLERIPGITKDQTQRLIDLHADVYIQSQEMTLKKTQNKVLLFKYLAVDDTKKIELVKRDITNLHLKKLDLMLESFDKVKKILGNKTRKILLDDDFRLYHGLTHERF